MPDVKIPVRSADTCSSSSASEFTSLPIVAFSFLLFHQLQDLHRRVIVVEHVALRRFLDELRVHRGQLLRHLLHDVPLSRGRKWNPKVSLETLKPVERNAGPVAQKP